MKRPKKRPVAKPHKTHRMTGWTTAVRSPAGTPRFYGVRQCKRCGEEEMKHPAGHFLNALEQPCKAAPAKRTA